jgi:hypothetical protein
MQFSGGERVSIEGKRPGQLNQRVYLHDPFSFEDQLRRLLLGSAASGGATPFSASKEARLEVGGPAGSP